MADRKILGQEPSSDRMIGGKNWSLRLTMSLVDGVGSEYATASTRIPLDSSDREVVETLQRLKRTFPELSDLSTSQSKPQVGP